MTYTILHDPFEQIVILCWFQYNSILTLLKWDSLPGYLCVQSCNNTWYTKFVMLFYRDVIRVSYQSCCCFHNKLLTKSNKKHRYISIKWWFLFEKTNLYHRNGIIPSCQTWIYLPFKTNFPIQKFLIIHWKEKVAKLLLLHTHVNINERQQC